MKRPNWIVIGMALGMMVATAGWLQNFRGRHLLSEPGVRVGKVPIYGENNQIAATQSVVLPINVPGFVSKAGAVSLAELTELPQDTTFGRRFYADPASDFAAQISVVLMGTDHTSIHQPQYCLYGQDWTITRTERVILPMKHPFADIPAVKITATRQFRDGRIVNCLYVYWFVSKDKVTAEEGSRLWSMWKTMLQKGEMERWAYISYFVTCLPGHEDATFERLKQLIQASVPDFQLVKGQPSGLPGPASAQR